MWPLLLLSITSLACILERLSYWRKSILLKDNQLKIFYKARKFLYQLCNSDDFKIKFRLSKGMISMFDNLRLLHGRTKFDPNTGFRHLQGCYIDHDVTEGKLRRLVKS